MNEGVDLRVALFAKGVEVASSTDPAIWVSTMALVTGVQPALASGPSGASKVAGETGKADKGPGDDDLVAKMAREIGVSREELEGAAAPSEQAPFIHLDHKYWEALKSINGLARTPPPVLAASMLLLWDRHAKIGGITLKTCNGVLKTIDLTAKNAARGFKNCDWLQLRGNSIKLNPAQISKAESLVAAYCRSRTK